MAAKLFGRAEPGEMITVLTTGVPRNPGNFTATADDTGYWALSYNWAVSQAGLAPFNITFLGTVSEPVTLHNIAWGDVYMCIGEADMLSPLGATSSGAAWLANHSKLLEQHVRLFPAVTSTSTAPQFNFAPPGNGNNCSGLPVADLQCNTWQAATTQAAAGFSSYCLQSVAALLATANPGNSIVGVVQMAAPAVPVDSLLPTAADAAPCAPAPAAGAAYGGFFNGTVAPIVYQVWRALLLHQGASSDLVAPGADTPGAAEAYGCKLRGLLSALRSRQTVGDFPTFVTQLPAPAVGTSPAVAPETLFEYRVAQAAAGAPQTGGTGTEASALLASWDPAAANASDPAAVLASRFNTSARYVAYWGFSGPGYQGPTPTGVLFTSGFPGTLSISFDFSGANASETISTIALAPAPSCPDCCAGAAASGVFQVQARPADAWLNATWALNPGATGVRVYVPPSAGTGIPFAVRYGATAATAQCALLDAATGLPALPFLLNVSMSAPAQRPATPKRGLRAQLSPVLSAISPLPTADDAAVTAAWSAITARLQEPLVDAAAWEAAMVATAAADGDADAFAAAAQPTVLSYLDAGRERAAAFAAARDVTGLASPPGVLAPLPPMGWNSWQAFRCNVDEALFLAAGDALAASGLPALGYSYVNFDDCVMRSRLANGSLIPDETRFPSGMRALGDALHAKGLRFGIYTSQTAKTCVGRPAAYEHEAIDVARYCEWAVDFLKVDNCGGARYPDLNTSWINLRAAMGNCPAASPAGGAGSSMVLSVESCGSPRGCGLWIRRNSTQQMWRTTSDLQLSWSSVLSNLDGNSVMAPLAGPGGWNDPDMLITGHPALNAAEARSHVTGWVVSAAPLLISADVASLAPADKALLSNPEVIAVDQDAAGVQGVRVSAANATGVECWAKPLTPPAGSSGSVNVTAVMLFNRGPSASDVVCTWQQLGIPAGAIATVRDLWQRADLPNATADAVSAAAVPSHGTVLLKLVTGA